VQRALSDLSSLMTHTASQVRVVAGSHLNTVPHNLRQALPRGSQRAHLPEEEAVFCGAGDVVCVHCDVLHTGSANTAGAYRYFVTSYLRRALFEIS
jgi:ectoine hydroxylase-related dioxygenase (phytanoyl-CoA dioxygenase family)